MSLLESRVSRPHRIVRLYIARTAVSLAAIAWICGPYDSHAQGLENPTDAELLATASLIAFPSFFMDTLNVNDPHMEGFATKMYKFQGVAGDSVTIYAGSLMLDLLIAFGDSTGSEFDMIDNDSGPGANPMIDAELPFDGMYFLMVMPSAQRTYGQVSLAVTEGARAKAGRDEDDVASPLEATQKRWAQYGRSQSGWSYYDRETLERTGDGVSVRTRFAYRELQENTRGDIYDSRLMRVEIRCADRQSRLSDVVETRGGAVVDRTDITGEWTAIVPKSNVEALLEALCSD